MDIENVSSERKRRKSPSFRVSKWSWWILWWTGSPQCSSIWLCWNRWWDKDFPLCEQQISFCFSLCSICTNTAVSTYWNNWSVACWAVVVAAMNTNGRLLFLMDPVCPFWSINNSLFSLKGLTIVMASFKAFHCCCGYKETVVKLEL